MKQEMLDVLEKTYNNQILRQTTVPLFMSNPGLGKSSIVKEFAELKEVTLLKTTLSQRMPNEVVGGVMPSLEKRVWLTLDNEHLYNLKDGDIWFIDEVFNGTMKQTLDALLNFIEDRILPSGRPLANVMIIGASNPQGLINLTPQIKERFIRYDLRFDKKEYQEYLLNNYVMPYNISNNLCTLINKETFETGDWNYKTPRSLEKALNQIGCELKSPFDDILIPYLSEKFITPTPFNDKLEGEEIEYLEILKTICKLKNKIPTEAPEIKTQKENDTKNKIQQN